MAASSGSTSAAAAVGGAAATAAVGGAAATAAAGSAAASASPKIVTAIVVGMGQRGHVYAQYALDEPSKFKIVGVAEPREFHRSTTASLHGIPADNVFTTWEDAAKRPKFADAVIITTQDSMHVAPALAFAALGYHILLEKPMAVTAEDCKAIVAAVKAAGIFFAVGHVLRYTPYMQRIIRLIRSGAIGEVVNIQHLEPIGHAHFSHSYVRGNWRKESESSFMLMAKCCHDVDLLRYMMGKRCERVSSFGSLYHLHPGRKPAAAAARCLECPADVERACAFSAKRIYLEPAKAGYFSWPVSVILDGEPSVPAVEEALAKGPYGRCVWACDNDVCDNQVVNMQFEGGATASLTTVAYTEKVCKRNTRIYGTKGQLEGDGESAIHHFDFLTRTATTYFADAPPAHSKLRGHGGADYFLVKGFVDAIATGDARHIVSGPDETLESHLMVFAAEQARHKGTVVSLCGDGDATPLEARDFSW